MALSRPIFELMTQLLGKIMEFCLYIFRIKVIKTRERASPDDSNAFNIFLHSMYDVGGQRSQRRKWVYCFEDVRAVLFVVALSGYDMTLLEDSTVNRLEESLNLFEQIVNNRWFKEASFVLFLNKLDLFREKIMNTNRHLRNFFPDYKGK